MGMIYLHYLLDDSIYACAKCNTHISSKKNIFKKFIGANESNQFLLNKVVNICEGTIQQRPMLSGLHTVSDIYCIDCQAMLGWKYVQAFESDQKFKEGKFWLEKSRIQLISF